MRKDVELFHKCKTSSDGHTWWCKQCKRENSRETFRSWYPTNKDKRKDYYAHISNNPDPKKALEFSIQDLVGTARNHSKRRKVPYDITYEYLMEVYNKQQGRCYYTNTPMKLKGNGRLKKDLLGISLDKLIPENGYVEGNVVLCCFGINLLKHTHTKDTMMSALQTFYNNAKNDGKLVEPPALKPGVEDFSVKHYTFIPLNILNEM